MELIDNLVAELTDICTDWNSDNDIETRNLRLDLLIQSVAAVELNLDRNPLENMDEKVKQVFRQLMFRHRFKAVSALTALKQIEDRKRFNKVARNVIDKKLFFPPLHRTMTRNIKFYTERNKMHYVTEFPIFQKIKGKGEGDSNE